MAGRKQWTGAVLTVVLVAGCAPDPGPAAAGAARDLGQSLRGLEALAQQFPPAGDTPLRWPEDHAAHGGQFTESWLVAGLLRDGSGGRHGFQLLLQRVALQAEENPRESAWSAESAWHGRFVLESGGSRPVAAERFSRGALELAGTSVEPVAAWLDGWRLELDPAAGTMSLQARDGTAAALLQLALPAAAPAGLSGEARRGYWWPGLEVAGSMTREGASVAVHGQALLERWWGRAPAAGSGQLALVRLWAFDEAGHAVRCEHLRRRGGSGTPLGACTGYPSGAELAVEPAPLDEGRTAAIAPLRWRLDWPAAGGERTWQPLAEPGPPGAEWSGLLVPAGDADKGWGLLVLSNFTAP